MGGEKRWGKERRSGIIWKVIGFSFSNKERKEGTRTEIF